jgi:aromatic-L-amino-acid/L-tryptophan decarboxylase
MEQMRKELLALQEQCAALEPDTGTRNAWDTAILDYAHRFVDGLPEGKAYDTGLSKGDKLLERPVPEDPQPVEEVLDFYLRSVDEPGLNPASGGHLGYIPGGGIYAAALGDYIAAVGNRYAGIYYGSPGAVQMEHALIRWMADLFSFGVQAGGTLCSGGSIANLVAICAARDNRELRPAQYEKAVIYLTDQVHHCIDKALRIAGLEYACVRRIPMDALDQMRVDALAQQVQKDKEDGWIPWLVVASAGTTDTGAIDPLEAIGDLCRRAGMWFHVDAAYGGFFVLTEEGRQKLRGLDMADSLVIDPHKGLFLPYGLGAVLVKDQRHLLRTNYYLANYMQDAYRQEMPSSPADLSPELTRHFRALRLWLPLQLMGLRPFRAALEEKLKLGQYAAEQLGKLPGVALRNPPRLSVVCFRLVADDDALSDQRNLALVDHIKQDGKVFLSSTVIDGRVYVRMAILSFRTHLDTVDYALDQIRLFLAGAENAATGSK